MMVSHYTVYTTQAQAPIHWAGEKYTKAYITRRKTKDNIRKIQFWEFINVIPLVFLIHTIPSAIVSVIALCTSTNLRPDRHQQPPYHIQTDSSAL